jgi:hypothetical protein
MAAEADANLCRAEVQKGKDGVGAAHLKENGAERGCGMDQFGS